MMDFVDPVIISAAARAIIALVDWKKVFKGLANDAAGKGAKRLLERLQPGEREKAAKVAVQLFVEEFLPELEDKTPLSSAIPGYREQLSRLIEYAAPDIAGWLEPETKDVDFGPVERMWGGLGLDPLPEDFDWKLVSKSYARSIRKHVKSDPALRGGAGYRAAGTADGTTTGIGGVAGAHGRSRSRLQPCRVSRVPAKKMRAAAAFGDAHQHL